MATATLNEIKIGQSFQTEFFTLLIKQNNRAQLGFCFSTEKRLIYCNKKSILYKRDIPALLATLYLKNDEY